jgi:transposase
MSINEDKIYLQGPSGCLAIGSHDQLGKKIAMLMENKCLGVHAVDAAQKYGFSRSRFYQIKHAFETEGTEALIDSKRGPKKNYVRTDIVNNQIIRHRFLDPDASAAVISQKMRQVGYKISVRSVERTITELGLQKKTPSLKSSERTTTDRDPSDQKEDDNM